MPKNISSRIKEITFISIGGQGALAGAEILASAMIMEGRIANVNVFTTGERRNAPVINNIKVADGPPLPNCKNYMTTEMIVFKETLFDAKVPAILWSMQTLRSGILMVNSSKPPNIIEFPFDFEGIVATVDAEKICHEVVGILPPPFGITILGMYLAVTRAVKWETLESAIMERFPGKVGERNVEAVRIAMAQTRIEKKRKIVGKEKRQELKPIPLEEVNSVESYEYIPLQRVGQGSYRIWREHLPVCDSRLCFCEKCVSASYCPEGIAVLTDQGFWTDYGFCKGCGICAKECIHGAIRMVPMSTPPCQFHCPIGQDIPGYIALIAESRYKEALELILEKNPLPGICGRICHHPCELGCRRTDLDEALAIRNLKRFAAEKGTIGFQKLPNPSNKGDIAIVGSGPAGLTAAYHLVKMGYSPTIFEASSKLGGIMTSSIPEFVLPRSVIQSDIDNILSLGINIQTGVTIGKDHKLKDLFEQGFKAIFLSTGSPKSVPLRIPGIDLENVYLGIPFLEAVKKNQISERPGRVVIIGGGNVAIDCARTAIRLGGQEVHMACLESREEMPAHSWEIDDASREGIKIHCSLAPQKFIGRYGKVNAVEFKKVESIRLDEKGRIQWTLIEDTPSLHLRADRVIVAIGQTTDLNFLENNSDMKLELKENHTIKVHPITQGTSVKGIFAGGDVTTGSASVVEAIAAGERVAKAIDKFLAGAGVILEKVRKASKVEDISFNLGEIEEKNRIEPKLEVVDSLVHHFQEIECNYSEQDAKEEAHRCTRCDLRGEIDFWLRPVDFDEEIKKN